MAPAYATTRPPRPKSHRRARPEPTIHDTVTESQLQNAVVGALRQMGYLTYHTRYSLGSNPGFPDVVAIRPPHVIFIELKRENGAVTVTQREWIRAAAGCTRVDAFVLRPSGLTNFVARLSEFWSKPQDAAPR